MQNPDPTPGSSYLKSVPIASLSGPRNNTGLLSDASIEKCLPGMAGPGRMGPGGYPVRLCAVSASPNA